MASLDEFIGRARLRELLGYLVSLRDRRFYGKVTLSFHDGKIISIRPEENLDMKRFGWEPGKHREAEAEGGEAE